ncbi:hypothetical protein [Clostridium estertheticum]|uniref:hypothetical protein n=1 Tax=Clostridium estertheticum TaxID=238834 RepID=UPI001C0CD855|nr:hypothetical protein [Clostridium estertheticum]MBU3185666.1 hypothetical protein [Clostridium estertheticum]
MSLPNYVVNFDELADAIKSYLENGIKVDVGDITFSTIEMERLLQEISGKIQGIDYNSLITALNALGVKLDGLAGNLGISGTQKIYGKMLEIPAIRGLHSIEFKVPQKGRITGITYSLSAWNFQDSWDLVVEKENIFDKVRTKEYGEHKYFNVFYPVASGQIINFNLNNESGSSKVLWVDFNILEDS